MRADPIREQLYKERIVVVLREKDPDTVREKARAVKEGGLNIQEVTWTTPSAPELIREFRKEKLGIIGAGTILELADARKAVAAGAQFLVSPVFTKAVNTFAKQKKVPYIPGCATAQETYTAWKEGARPIKVFPAPTLGGPEYIRRLLAPMPFLELFPTLISLDDIRAYLDSGARGVGVGVAAISEPEGVEQFARQVGEIVRQSRVLMIK